MTKKDYELIASQLTVVKAHYKDGSLWREGGADVYEAVVVRLSLALEQDNPRFDRDKFLKDCGVE